MNQRLKEKWENYKKIPTREKLEQLTSACVRAGLHGIGYMAILPFVVAGFIGFFGLYWFFSYLEITLPSLFWTLLSLSLVCMFLMGLAISILVTETLFKELRREYWESRKKREKRKKERENESRLRGETDIQKV